MKTKWIRTSVTLFLVTVLIALYFSGPTPPKLTLDATIPVYNSDPLKLEEEIKSREENVLFLKSDNQARIIWADSTKKQKTEYCIVYLHGFSATWKEGDPVHKSIAKKFGCNLYLPRLFEHGLQKQEPLLDFEAEAYLKSAKIAIAEAKILGEKVIVMSTSTGGTLSLFMAAENPDIEALVLYSPNINLSDSKSFLLTQPWGLQLARKVVNSNYYSFKAEAEAQQYWNTRYRIEALITLKNLMNHTMKKKVFNKVKQPVLLCYYYKNAEEQDKVVSIKAMQDMYIELGTPANKKREFALPETKAHAIASGISSKNTKAVEEKTEDFLQEVLGMKTVIQ